jgi:hypothetical protein
MKQVEDWLFSTAQHEDHNQADDEHDHKSPDENAGIEDVADYLATGHQ